MSVFGFTIVERSGENDIQMIEYTNADMKGYIPPSLINMTLGSLMQTEYTDMAIYLNKVKAEIVN